MDTVCVEGVTLKVKTSPAYDETFLTQKLKRIYKKIDFDGHGYIKRDDYVTWGEKSGKMAEVDPWMHGNMNEWLASYDAFYDQSETFLEWKTQFQSKIKIKGLDEFMKKVTSPLFKAIDFNDDGLLSWDEYKTLVVPLGATEAEAHIGFGSIDRNGNGVINYDEFHHAFVMYYTERKDSNYKHFYGEWKSDDGFLIEKLRRVYNRFDLDHDGVVTKNDWLARMRKVTDESGVRITDDLKESWTREFDAFIGNTKSFEEFKMHWLNLAENADELRGLIDAFTIPCLKAIDVHDKGTITWEEYKAWVTAAGATVAEAHMGFWAVDTSGAGVFTLKEFSSAMCKYYTDKTDTNFKHFYGEFKPDDSFLIKKLRRIYELNDFHDHGVVKEEDFLWWGEKTAAFAGVEFTNQTKKYWIAAYEAYFGDAKNFGEWRDRLAYEALKSPSQVGFHVKIAFPRFKAIDFHGKNTISWNEYKCFVLPLGVTEAEAHVGFGMIDFSGDGKLSYQEFAFAEAMYYMDRTDSKFKHFYGEWKD